MINILKVNNKILNNDIKNFKKIESLRNKIIKSLLMIQYIQYILIKDLNKYSIKYIKNNIILNTTKFFNKKLIKKGYNKYIYYFIKKKTKYFIKKGINKKTNKNIKKFFKCYLFYSKYIKKLYKIFINIKNKFKLLNNKFIKNKFNKLLYNKKSISMFLLKNQKKTNYITIKTKIYNNIKNKNFKIILNTNNKAKIKKIILFKKLIKIKINKFNKIKKNTNKLIKIVNFIKQIIIINNKKNIKNIINAYNKDPVIYQSLIQEGFLIIIKAIDKFNFRFKMSFYNYIKPWVKERIKKIIIKYNKIHNNKLINIQNSNKNKIKNNLSDYYNNYRKDNTINSIYIDIRNNEYKNKIRNLIPYLSKKEQKVIIYRYGIKDNIFKTLKQTGNKYNLSKERIRQIENSAIKKIKNIFYNIKLD